MKTENIVDGVAKTYSTPELTVHGKVVEATRIYDPSSPYGSQQGTA
jgi:hypothetical protein